MLYLVIMEGGVVMTADGVTFGRIIDFRALLTSTTFQMHQRLCAFGVRACLREKMLTIVLTCNNDYIG